MNVTVAMIKQMVWISPCKSCYFIPICTLASEDNAVAKNATQDSIFISTLDYQPTQQFL